MSAQLIIYSNHKLEGKILQLLPEIDSGRQRVDALGEDFRIWT